MKFFAIGLGIGSLAGLGISLLPNPQTGHKVKEDVRQFLNNTKNDATTLAASKNQAQAAASQLMSELPKAEQSVKDIQSSVTNFQSSVKPEVDQMKENISHLSQEVKSTADKVKNEI